MESIILDIKNIITALYLVIAVSVLGCITASPYMPSYGRTDMRPHWTRSIETPYRIRWNHGRLRILFKRQKTKIKNYEQNSSRV